MNSRFLSRKTLSLVALLVAVAGPAEAQQQSGAGDEGWVATWGTAQQYYQAPQPAAQQSQANPQPPPVQQANPQPAPTPAAVPATTSGPARRFGIPPRLNGLNNQTIRMIARTSIGGPQVRIRLQNALGARAVRIGAAHIAVRANGSAIVSGTDRSLTFSGQPSITLHAGQTAVSDPVQLEVGALTDLAVSLYLPAETGSPTTHTFGLRPTYVSREGDFTRAEQIADTLRTTQSYYWLAGIDVLAPADAAVIVGFGDSITDGDQSTPDTNGMWPAILAERLQRNPATRRIGVVNAGISGNRVLADNSGAVVRLEHDVLNVPGVRWMTLLEGINDITGATRNVGRPTLTAGDLIAAYRQIIARAHMQGVKVIGCTITPFGGSNVYTEAGEALRQEVNRWIRTSGEFDAVVDFDAATRDPRDPTRFRAEADSPDMLHPGDAGYRLMAEAFDLSIVSRQ